MITYKLGWGHYEVWPCSRQAVAPSLDGRVRKYYIAAKEVQRDYGSSGLNQISGKQLSDTGSPAVQYFKHSLYQTGGVYWKAKYVEYTDESFCEEKQQSEDEKYLGILGPVIKAEVGDTILMTFFNKASWPFSIQPHEVSYGKALEGIWYHEGCWIPFFEYTPVRGAGYLVDTNEVKPALKVAGEKV